MRYFTFVTITSWSCLFSTFASAKKAMSPAYSKMQEVANSPALSKAEKLKMLLSYLSDTSSRNPALYHIFQIDPAVAKAEIIRLFKMTNLTIEEKLELGHLALSTYSVTEILPDYSKFLVKTVLENGPKECNKAQSEDTMTSTGEYAFIAGDFMGMSSKYFENIKDPRVIPILIQCLKSPDNIYGAQEHVIRGKQGQATGRNLGRQLIPNALAKLNAKEALPELLKTLHNHHDLYLRINAAYAIALLGEEFHIKECIRYFLLANFPYRNSIEFSFAKGLLERQDERGFQFALFENANGGQSKDISESSYALSQTLEAILVFNDKQNPKFVQSLSKFFENPKLLELFAFDPAQFKLPTYMLTEKPQRKAEWLEGISKIVTKNYGTLLHQVLQANAQALAPQIRLIAEKSKLAEIRNISKKALLDLKSPSKKTSQVSLENIDLKSGMKRAELELKMEKITGRKSTYRALYPTEAPMNASFADGKTLLLTQFTPGAPAPYLKTVSGTAHMPPVDQTLLFWARISSMAKDDPNSAILRVVKKYLLPTGGLWMNGMQPSLGLAQSATDEEVLRKLFAMTSTDKGKITEFRILESKTVQNQGLFKAVYLDTNKGKKVVFMQFQKTGWWTKAFNDVDE